MPLKGHAQAFTEARSSAFRGTRKRSGVRSSAHIQRMPCPKFRADPRDRPCDYAALHPIRTKHPTLPDVLVHSADDDVKTALEPAFEVMWQASGRARRPT